MQRAVVVLIDYSRAYDKVCRDALLMKLSEGGIPSHMVRWIQAWLSNRLTWVTFDRVRSRTVTLKQGILQGSVLLPLLFYIDNLASAVGVPQVSLFADDVAVWTQDLERVASKLQKGLDAVASWSTSWKMKLSVKYQSVPSLPQTSMKQDGVKLYNSVDNRSSSIQTQSSLESHMIDSSPLVCMRPLSAAKWSSRLKR